MHNDIFKRYLHNPPHLFLPDTFYMLTASTYLQMPVISSAKRKMDWVESFLKAAEIYKWQVIAWVVLHNHYHAIVKSPENAHTLSKFVGSYHKFTSHKWNEEEGVVERKLWWNYWDTCLASERDYYTRLRYIFWNPVKHKLSDTPDDYPFSNYKEFLMNWQVDFNFTNMDEVQDVPEF
jgi:putative transposase